MILLTLMPSESCISEMKLLSKEIIFKTKVYTQNFFKVGGITALNFPQKNALDMTLNKYIFMVTVKPACKLHQ